MPQDGDAEMGGDDEGLEGGNSGDGSKKVKLKPAQGKQKMGPQGGQKFDKPNAVRITTPYMTKYERARILGTRALQIRYVQLLGYHTELTLSATA